MQELKRFYGKKYVDKIVSKGWREEQMPLAVDVLYEYFKPKSVVDVGAANGLHCKRFEELGVETFGIEGTPYFSSYLQENCQNFIIQDLRQPFTIERQFDLVYSVEVFEHIEPEKVDVLLDNIVRLGNTFFITASPETGGHGHYNPQPKEYWINKLQAKGLIFQKNKTLEIANMFRKVKVPGWYHLYSMVFEKK